MVIKPAEMYLIKFVESGAVGVPSLMGASIAQIIKPFKHPGYTPENE